jgi:uncharacterized MAPEG superfamily protein
LFAIAVVVAHHLRAPQAQPDACAIIFICARILYIAMYLANQATLRSLCWFIGMGSVIALFVISA